MTDPRLDNVVIILAGTKYSGNLGSVARAMGNMGIRHLRLAAPKCPIDEEARRMARGASVLLDEARTLRSLRSAARGIRLLVGTTGKSGGYRVRAASPRDLAPELLSNAARHKVGIVFGPEDTGLIDEDLLPCQLLLRIPTHRDMRSLNLSHAVMVVCYELFLASKGRSAPVTADLAPVEQIEAMYSQLEKALLRIGFLHEQNARHMMFAIRRLLGRAGLEKADVGVLRGIARQIAWFGRNPPEGKNDPG